MISELPLQRIKVLTDLALEKLKSYIAQKYEHQTHVQKAMVLSDAVHRIIDRHLPRYGTATRDQIRKNIIMRALDRRSFNIDCSHLFRSMVQQKRTGDDDFYKVLAGWWTDKTHEKVEPWELYHYVQANPEILETTLKAANSSSGVLDSPLTKVEEEAFVMFKAVEPKLTPSIERRLPGPGRKPPVDDRKLLELKTTNPDSGIKTASPERNQAVKSALAEKPGSPQPAKPEMRQRTLKAETERPKIAQTALKEEPETPGAVKKAGWTGHGKTVDRQNPLRTESRMPSFERRHNKPVDRQFLLESVYEQYCQDGLIEDDKKIRKRLNKKRPKPGSVFKPLRRVSKPAVYAGLSAAILLLLFTAYLSIQSIIAQGKETLKMEQPTLESSDTYGGVKAVGLYPEETHLLLSDETVPVGSPTEMPPEDLPLMTMEATAYDLSYTSCKKYPDHPEYGITSSGTQVVVGRTVAVDPEIIPLGSKLYIYFPPDFAYLDGYYFAEDTGSLIQGMKIDIYMGEDQPGEKEAAQRAKEFGVQTVKVAVVEE